MPTEKTIVSDGSLVTSIKNDGFKILKQFQKSKPTIIYRIKYHVAQVTTTMGFYAITN